MLYCTYLRYRKVREVKGAARDYRGISNTPPRLRCAAREKAPEEAEDYTRRTMTAAAERITMTKHTGR